MVQTLTCWLKKISLGILTIFIGLVVGVAIYVLSPFDNFLLLLEVLGELGRSYAWPLVILALLGWAFREPLQAAISRVQEVKGPGFQAVLDAMPHLDDIELIGSLQEGDKSIIQGDWGQAGHVYWLSYNLTNTIPLLYGENPQKKAYESILRCLHHASKIGVDSGVTQMLKSAGAMINHIEDGNDIQIEMAASSIREVFHLVGRITQNAQSEQPFDAGPY